MPSLRIQIVSDIHLEFTPQPVKTWESYLVPSAPYLALLGDISPLRSPALKQFLERVCPRYEKVFYVYGNHEWYDTKPNCVIQESKKKFQKWVKDNLDNLIILDDSTYDLEGYRLIGGTMWGNVDGYHEFPVKAKMNDYHLIHGNKGKLDVMETNIWHAMFNGFLREQLILAEAEKKPVIVFTHHAPLFDKRMLDDQYWGDPCNQAFMADMSEHFTKNIKLWAFGHTHHCTDFVYEATGTRVYSNPKGHNGDVANYDKEKVVELR